MPRRLLRLAGGVCDWSAPALRALPARRGSRAFATEQFFQCRFSHDQKSRTKWGRAREVRGRYSTGAAGTPRRARWSGPRKDDAATREEDPKAGRSWSHGVEIRSRRVVLPLRLVPKRVGCPQIGTNQLEVCP